MMVEMEAGREDQKIGSCFGRSLAPMYAPNIPKLSSPAL